LVWRQGFYEPRLVDDWYGGFVVDVPGGIMDASTALPVQIGFISRQFGASASLKDPGCDYGAVRIYFLMNTLAVLLRRS
jgi:hypothetical protein